MSDFEARLHQIADKDGRLSVNDVLDLLHRCKLRGQTQTFRETRIGKDAADEALKVILQNIALTVLLGKGGKIHRNFNPGPMRDAAGAVQPSITVVVRMEILKW